MDVLIRFNPNISHSCFAYRVHIWSLLIHFQVMFWMDWFFGKVIYVETSKQNRKTTCKTDLTNDFRFGCKKDSSQTIQYAQKFRIKYHLWDNWKHFSLKLRFSKPNSTLETHWKKKLRAAWDIIFVHNESSNFHVRIAIDLSLVMNILSLFLAECENYRFDWCCVCDFIPPFEIVSMSKFSLSVSCIVSSNLLCVL